MFGNVSEYNWLLFFKQVRINFWVFDFWELYSLILCVCVRVYKILYDCFFALVTDYLEIWALVAEKYHKLRSFRIRRHPVIVEDETKLELFAIIYKISTC